MLNVFGTCGTSNDTPGAFFAPFIHMSVDELYILPSVYRGSIHWINSISEGVVVRPPETNAKDT